MRRMKPRSILVVRHDHIGDLVCTMPLLRGLREGFPEARITALVNTYNRAVLAGSPDVDEVLAYVKSAHSSSPATLIAGSLHKVWTLLRLRARRVDVLVVASTPMSPRLERLARTIRPRCLVAASVQGRPNTVAVPPESLGGLHEVERVWSLGKALGLEGPPPEVRIRPEPSNVEAMQRRLAGTHGLPLAKPVVVHLSARRPSQQWPVDHFAELLQRLHRADPALTFLVLWAPGKEGDRKHSGDDSKAEELLRRLPDGFPANFCRTPTLPETIAALSLGRAFIGSDGGAMHLAAGLGLPIVCLFGKSLPTRWRPWTRHYALLQASTSQVTDISPGQVAESFRQLEDSASTLPTA